MKNHRIFKRIFMITALTVLLILLVQFVFQIFLFEKYYIYSNSKVVRNVLSSIEYDIENEVIAENMIERRLQKDSIENDIFIGITNGNGVPIYGLSRVESLSYMLIESDSGKQYRVNMDSFTSNDKLQDEIEIGDTVRVLGINAFVDNSRIYPESIYDGENVFFPDDMGNIVEVGIVSATMSSNDIVIVGDTNEAIEISELPLSNAVEKQEIEGIVVEKSFLGKEQYGIEYRRSRLIEESFLLLRKEKMVIDNLKNSFVEYLKTDSFTGIRNQIFAKTINLKNGEEMIMFAVSSLQPVENTFSIMMGYYVFLLILAMTFAVLVSYACSKKFTNPLIHLDDVTNRMSNLDFSLRCDIDTGDEIEDLASSINKMSDRLEVTLEEIKESNDKLKEQLEYKERMELFRKRLLEDASHELKTPLTVMKGICEGILDGVYDLNDKSHLRKVLSHADYMSNLVYDLLEVSKIENGQIPLKIEEFRYCDLVDDIKDKLQPLIDEKEHSVEVVMCDGVVKGDREKIKKVIMNLFQNAIQYTPIGGEILIKICFKDREGFFSIENTPAFIDKSQMDLLWEPYYRIEKSRNKNLGGSGLGLYLVKEVLEKHKSQYGIQNTLKGVRFYFSLREK